MRADQLRDLIALELSPEVLQKVVEIADRPSRDAIRMRTRRAHVRDTCATSSEHDAHTSRTVREQGGTIGGEVISFEDRKEERKKPPTPNHDDQEFFDAYNVCARELGWTLAKKLDRRRSAAIRRCIADAGNLEQAFDHLNDFANSKHGQEFGAGQNDREWRVDIDYLTRRSKWVQIIEGKFNGVQSQD